MMAVFGNILTWFPIGTFGYLFLFPVMVLLLFLTRNVFNFATADSEVGPDASVHMVLAREIRNNNHAIPQRISASVWESSFNYPPFLHFLLSYIPSKHYELINKYFPFILDLLYLGLLALLIQLRYIDIMSFLLLSFIFIVSPQFTNSAAGIGISARKPGAYLCTLSILLLVSWHLHGLTIYLLGSILIGSLVLITSRFATQALVAIFLCLSTVEPFSIVILGLIFSSAVFLTKGRYIGMLKYHLSFMRQYATKKQFQHLYNGFHSVKTIKSITSVRTIRDVISVIGDSILIFGFLYNPYIVVAIIGLLTIPSPMASIPTIFLSWFFAGLLAFLFTSVYGFRFLGRPERYLQFSFIPSGLIIIYSLNEDTMFMIGLLTLFSIIGLLLIYLQFKRYQRRYRNKNDEEEWLDLLEFLDSLESSTIITVKRMGDRVVWNCPKHTVCDFFGDFKEDDYPELYPTHMSFITGDIDLLEERFDPDWVIFRQGDLSEIPKDSLSPPATSPFWSNSAFSVYRFEDYS